MPVAGMRPCSRPGCNRLVQYGSLCPAHRVERERERGSAVQRGYGYEWRQRRAAFLRKHVWCADPFGVHGAEQVRAVHVDHVVPRNQGGDDDEGNLMGLCTSCHSRKTAKFDGGFGNEIKPSRGGV